MRTTWTGLAGLPVPCPPSVWRSTGQVLLLESAESGEGHHTQHVLPSRS